MAINIGRNLAEIDFEIKKINASVKEGEKELVKFDKALNLDSGDVSAVKQKFEQLPKILSELEAKANAVKEKQEQLNNAFKDGNIKQTTYNNKIIDTNKQLAEIEQKTKDYRFQLSKQNEELRNAKFDNFINGANKAEQSAQKYSRAVAAATAAVAAFIIVGINAGDELDDIASKYGTTAEALQYQRNYYDKLTESADGYEAALKSIGTIQTGITSGRGKKYLTFLQDLNLTQSDLNNKTNGEIYDMIFEKLRMVTDETERARIAQGLFGDSGLNVALVAGATDIELEKLNIRMQENGLISNEQAKIAGEYADKMADIKNQIMEFALKMLEWWDSLGGVGQKIIMFLLITIVALPKIIAMVKGVAAVLKVLKIATIGQAIASGALSTAAAPLLIVLMAIAAVVLTLLGLFNKLTKSENDAANGMDNLTNQLNGMQNNLGKMGTDFSVSTMQTQENNSHKTVDVNIKSSATGDSKISKENAVMISDTLSSRLESDYLNAEWGRKISGG